MIELHMTRREAALWTKDETSLLVFADWLEERNANWHADQARYMVETGEYKRLFRKKYMLYLHLGWAVRTKKQLAEERNTGKGYISASNAAFHHRAHAGNSSLDVFQGVFGSAWDGTTGVVGVHATGYPLDELGNGQ